ncbi:MAG: bifunctional hydroxymethylpyrimidine kinase/phosphomethylpyrimidine kinase [Gemmatimonadota bacterium]|nr:MAG: bifunctional hydroxymethylpyrimidine kinase/phosphomethylpyrimidine kinase [Gemmatimonadota bacterium]
MTARRVALTIAGSDSGGGAGIQADLKTFHAFGVFGTSAITAITAQNTVGVRAIQKVDPAVVADQIRAVAEDLRPAASKTGMLADASIVEAVASAIRDSGLGHLVVDPVMVAKSGDRLLEADAVAALASELLPLSEVITPNLPEAAILAGRAVEAADDMRAAAEILAEKGAQSVLIKGGHLTGDVLVDLYFDGTDWHEWRETRRETRHTHGTGCTLSAAICAGLALGWRRIEAVEKAREFTQRAIETAPGLGKGHGPLNHWVNVEL